MSATSSRAQQRADPNALDRVDWLTDLVRLEIVLWNRVDACLRERHALSLAFFEALHFISRAPGGSLRVGDLATAMRITVGGASKLVDRIEAAGLIERSPDPDDRRAARVKLTRAGRRRRRVAVATYEQALAACLDAGLSESEQRQMHSFVTRLLPAAGEHA